MNVNEQAKMNEDKNTNRETCGKIKTSELMIIVNGSADKPCYSIRYYDLSDNEWHVDFSSYCLSYVMKKKEQYFEIVEPVERMPMEDTDAIYKKLDQAQKELDCKNREIIQIKEEFLDLRRNYDYLDGKTDAYEYAIKCKLLSDKTRQEDKRCQKNQ